MLNVPLFIGRLEELLRHFSLSPSALADQLGVQRSGISHLLSGRNKPGLDFILKLSEAFPELNLYWLLRGEGDMLGKGLPSGIPEAVLPQQPAASTQPASASSEIERVIICYKDGTFSVYQTS